MGPMTPSVRVAVDSRDQLGESPTWSAATQELLRVDGLAGRVHAWAPASGATSSLAFDVAVGAVVPRAGGGLLVAAGRDIVLVAAGDTAREVLATVDHEPAGNRFNDCRCDPQGRLWAGTMSPTRDPGTAALYRLEAGGPLTCVVAGTTLSNGLGWSPAGDLLYFVDSTTRRIDAFDVDVATGTPSGRRTFATAPPDGGMPDGLCVDVEGGVWVCLYGAGELRRHAADGTLDAVIALPAPHVTCPAFGGPDLATLYVTSGRHRLTPEQDAAHPHAGAVFALDVPVRGLPAGTFAG
jgi:sugar lactone lactonase YvrE